MAYKTDVITRVICQIREYENNQKNHSFKILTNKLLRNVAPINEKRRKNSNAELLKFIWNHVPSTVYAQDFLFPKKMCK